MLKWGVPGFPGHDFLSSVGSRCRDPLFFVRAGVRKKLHEVAEFIIHPYGHCVHRQVYRVR